MLSHPFVTFHKDLAKEAQDGGVEAPTCLSPFKRQSFMLAGTAERHNAILGYQKVERSLTTLLATMLQQSDLQKLVELLMIATQQLEGFEEMDGTEHTAATVGSLRDRIESRATDARRLRALPLSQVTDIVRDDLGNVAV